ncbi:transposase [Aequoribacter fuscus]|uniref:Transposase n=1 Tax=Aequoribacter fuscus TaxID=2518989 RepID=F3L2K4_9GAMM|nr:transposase [Aequoribacter fuscus]
MNFALLDLFGYRFAPRYAQVGRVINELFNITEDKNQQVHISLRKPINTQRIMAHWDNNPADCRLFGSAQDQSGQVSA